MDGKKTGAMALTAWSEDIMTFTQLNLMEIKRPNIASNSTGEKLCHKKMKCALVLKGHSVSSAHFDSHVQEHLSRSRDTKALSRDAT